MPNPAAPLVRVERGGVEEGIHLGHVAVVDAHGRIHGSLGDPQHVTYFRSCAKPFQAIGSLGTGIAARYALGTEHVAIMAASHNGEPRHVEIVRDVLRRTGIDESALQCGAHWPYYEPAATVVRREMDEPLAVFNNCSGKHAGMLAAARALDAPLETYLDAAHPVQQRIREVIEAFTRCPAANIQYGIDGCSAPNAAVPLAAMARSFAGLVSSSDEIPRTVVAAMVEQPFLIGGSDRFDTRLMEVTEGRLLAKGGAAGAHCTADRRSKQGLAVKLDSGDGTWTAVAVMAALERLGWLDAGEREALSSFARPTLRNHKRLAVGTVRPVFRDLVTAV
ncbi:MAG TPA: asparaginase [Candidatus Dormibacteraeota bacterium]|nr:asparaginase [Candidatus Dormibacteraeota bacterium]